MSSIVILDVQWSAGKDSAKTQRKLVSTAGGPVAPPFILCSASAIELLGVIYTVRVILLENLWCLTQLCYIQTPFLGLEGFLVLSDGFQMYLCPSGHASVHSSYQLVSLHAYRIPSQFKAPVVCLIHFYHLFRSCLQLLLRHIYTHIHVYMYCIGT